jgi:hypothetical protein
MPGSYIDDTLRQRVLFVTGKGGVGKSTVAWATALACARRGRRVAVVSWNPLEAHAAPEEGDRAGVKSIHLETLAAFREYAIQILKFETIYHVVFDNHVLKTFIKAAPGLAETVISGKIWDLYDKREQDLLIVDLPASGHAVSFFQSPLGIQKIFAVGFVHKEAGKIAHMFEAEDTRIDLVVLPEELPLVEGRELKEKLEGLFPFHFGRLHVNACTPSLPSPSPQVAESYGSQAFQVRERHLERMKLEEEALSLVPEYQMPSHRIPRFGSPSLEETIEKVSRFLEEA